MKKSVIAFIISLILLVISIILVLVNNNSKETITLMNKEYIENNFEINLFEDNDEGKIVLYSEGYYLGKDKIVVEPTILLDIKCIYSYYDAKQLYTNQLIGEMKLEKENDIYYGTTSFEIDKEINNYACSYEVIDSTGKYVSEE